ncbi:hypothetical protein PPL_12497 [Heterostelium album PN500]|uniref:FNIP repeat-containing protein n=1 Tax=Heterostelium pallidum (strain ATCC 26659 / Pp 5 / PN500) TaxID=670386 RepID=D3BMS4_HETP5|nr:hypothetical protein PPL_12497 [Heterostelium album PN500]EFA77286.1 hypothetical protein PPL_12497 [Heterostelium album PN500]|eukprot:XP_020429415.1 hypothetical protein PPL_12497 [Heterostelium album PN500]
MGGSQSKQLQLHQIIDDIKKTTTVVDENTTSMNLKNSVVNVSSKLLNSIIIQLDGTDSERICFSLPTSDKWYKQKDSYFKFNSDTLYRSLRIKDQFQFTANNDKFDVTISLNSDFTMFIGNQEEIKDHQLMYYEYYYNYNDEIIDIPSKVKVIKLSNSFNSDLNLFFKDKLANSNVVSICLGRDFNHSLENVKLPPTLESIRLGDSFNHPIRAGLLPSTVTRLAFGKGFASYNETVLPVNLKELAFEFHCDVNQLPQSFLKSIPSTLTSVGSVTPSSLDLLKKQFPSIETISLTSEIPQNLENGSIPSTITELTISAPTNVKPGSIPSSIKRFNLGLGFFSGELNDILPMDAKYDSLDLGYNRHIMPLVANSLPLNIKHLRLPSSYNHPLVIGSIPKSVESLHLGYEFDQELTTGVIPNSVRELTLSGDYTKPLNSGSIPNSVETLHFRTYNQKIKKNVLPSSIKTVSFSINAFQGNDKKLIESLPVSVQTILIYEFTQAKVIVNCRRIESDRFLMINCQKRSSIVGGFISSSSLNDLLIELSNSEN